MQNIWQKDHENSKVSEEMPYLRRADTDTCSNAMTFTH